MSSEPSPGIEPHAAKKVFRPHRGLAGPLHLEEPHRALACRHRRLPVNENARLPRALRAHDPRSKGRHAPLLHATRTHLTGPHGARLGHPAGVAPTTAQQPLSTTNII